MSCPLSKLLGKYLFILGLLVFYSAHGARQDEGAPSDTVLQGIQITEKEDSIILQIDFGIPLHYTRHFPPTAGEILQIQLVSSFVEDPQEDKTPAGSAEGGRDAKIVAKRESLLPPASDAVPLTNVTYEGDVPGGPFLTLRFKYPVEYTVAEGSGGRSVLITVKKDVGGLSIHASQEGLLPSEEKLDELMEDARQTLAREDHGRAIQLLSKILQLSSNKHSQEAKELMGVARERKGQVARAKLEYQEYLRLYPEGEGPERVKQRLAAIELGQIQPKEKLKEVKSKSIITQLDSFGRFTQRYYQDITNNDFDNSTDSGATLSSFFNASSRYRNDEYDIRGFINVYDIRVLTGEGGPDFKFNSLYVDLKNKEKKYSTSIGRQSSNKGGVFGRYDGIWASYEVAPKYEVSATIGKPIEFSSNGIDADKFFYGTSLALGTFKNNWDANVYFIDQKVEGIVDRRAIGGDLRYTDKIYTFFNSMDYDISYNILNILFTRIGWKINDQARIDLNYSLQQSPLILSTNALQQEGLTSFQVLMDKTTESELRAKVPKLSSLSRMLTIGVVYELDQNNQINADLSVSSLGAKPNVPLLTPPTNGSEPFIAASDKYGPEYSYSVQLISSNYFLERDIHIVGGRFSTGANRSTTSLFVRSRVPYGEQWYIGPRIQYDRTQNDEDDSQTSHPSLAVKVDYKWKKNVSFEGELSYELNDVAGGVNSDSDYARTTIFLGYNLDF